MANLHEAINAIHSDVVEINGSNQDDIIAKDSNGNTVSINWEQVNAWTNPNQYRLDRVYPPIEEQLDMIFHAGEGGDEFQAAIQAVKDEYPKPE